MQVRENLSMETESSTSFGNRRGFFITRTSLVLLSAFFVCSIIAAGFLIYNFVTCPQIPIESSVCDHHVIPLLTHSKNDSKTHYSKDQPHTTHVKEEAPYLRLPRSVVPTAYDIKLIPFIWPDNFTFLGDVRILVNVLESNNNITLHVEQSIKIKKEDVTVRQVENANRTLNGTASPNEVIAKQYFEQAKQFYVMEFSKKLQKGEVYEIHIKYVGVLDAYLQGFYRRSYVEGNKTKWLAATQFQRTDARRALPCFDEPALKARFNLSLVRPKNMSSLSNMPKLKKIDHVDGLPDYVWDIYQESVPMSTYLLAFVVSDFVNKSSGKFSVWTRNEASRSAEYARFPHNHVVNFTSQERRK